MKPSSRKSLSLSSIGLAAFMTGCTLQPAYESPSLPVAVNWTAQKPHGGQLESLANWWERFDDPAVAQLVRAAEKGSPDLAQALARIDSARATAAIAGAVGLPELTASGSVTRAKQAQSQQGTGQIATTRSAGLDASWEIDLFGRVRSGRESALAQLEASIDDWHDARVSLAAEVADTYVQYRGCGRLADAYRTQADSQAQTLEATRKGVSVGLIATTEGHLAEASAADSRRTLVDQQVQCEVVVKSLVALTGMEEAALQTLIDKAGTALPEPADFEVGSLPADLLRQRPDVVSAERTLAARYAEIGQARADRFPSLSLGGLITISASNLASSATSWSFGPSLSLPLLDGGERRAQVDAAVAAYEEQLGAYRGAVRAAVKEVEQTLVELDGAARRSRDARLAAEQYRRYAAATESNWRAGFDSLLALEEARRLAIAAEVADLQLHTERVRDWIALYKALGGGWSADSTGASNEQIPGGTS